MTNNWACLDTALWETPTFLSGDNQQGGVVSFTVGGAGQLYNDLHLNPFTAPDCQISRLNRCTDAPANNIVSGPVTPLL